MAQRSEDVVPTIDEIAKVTGWMVRVRKSLGAEQTGYDLMLKKLMHAIELKEATKQAAERVLTAEERRLMILEHAKSILDMPKVQIDHIEVENGMMDGPDPTYTYMQHKPNGVVTFTIRGHYYRKPKEETK